MIHSVIFFTKAGKLARVDCKMWTSRANDTEVINVGYSDTVCYSALQCIIMQYVTKCGQWYSSDKCWLQTVIQCATVQYHAICDSPSRRADSPLARNKYGTTMQWYVLQCIAQWYDCTVYNPMDNANGQALFLCYWRQPKTRLLSSYIWYKWQNKWCNGLQWNKTIYLQYQTSQMIQIAEGDERVTVWDFQQLCHQQHYYMWHTTILRWDQVSPYKWYNDMMQCQMQEEMAVCNIQYRRDWSDTIIWCNTKIFVQMGGCRQIKHKKEWFPVTWYKWQSGCKWYNCRCKTNRRLPAAIIWVDTIVIQLW